MLTFKKAMVEKEAVEKYPYQKILFVRNPLDRLVSFYSQFVVHKVADWAFADNARNTLLHDSSFSQFIYALKTLHDDGKLFQHHLKPQVGGIENESFHHIIDIDEFDEKIPELCRYFSIESYQLMQLNKTHYLSKSALPVYDLSPLALRAQGVPQHTLFWNKEIKALAKEIYSADIALYEMAKMRSLASDDGPGKTYQLNDPFLQKLSKYSAQYRRKAPTKTSGLSKIQLIGLSSRDSPLPQNSKRGLFEWVRDEKDASLGVIVYANLGIKQILVDSIDKNKKNIAWLSLSPTSLKLLGVYRFIDEYFSELVKAFDVVLTSDRQLVGRHAVFRYHPASNDQPDIVNIPIHDWYKAKVCSSFGLPKLLDQNDKAIQEHYKQLVSSSDIIELQSLHDEDGESLVEKNQQGLLPYMFNIAIENSRRPLYYSSILTNCFKAGTVPLYWGCDEISEVFDERGIITLNRGFNLADLNSDLYKHLQPYIYNNLQIAHNLESAEDLLFNRYIR